jgi:alpha-glucosidase
VDFKGGVNTETTKFYIDFCAKYGFEYFLFDDGWTDNNNILNVSKELNMNEISEYARKKNVGLMAWLLWSTFEKQMDEVFDLLEKWGFKGIKVDFMNRDDQLMVNFYEKVAAEAAKRKMVVDFHGAFKPAGLHRKYPNVLTCEGLIEFEYNGWTSQDTPDHRNLLPYIRMFAGPMDYIPGTVNNATKNDFRMSGEYPMGQGTRAHFIALAVILESPMMMLPDSPSDYYREEETTLFLSKIPVVWDEIKVLEAKTGDYTVIARKSGSEWYIGAITDWTPRDFEIKLDFLGDGNYQMEYFEDGKNANLRATDYKRKTETVSKSTTHKISLASGGGWAARISK